MNACTYALLIDLHIYNSLVLKDAITASVVLQNVGLCSAPTDSEQGGIFIVPYLHCTLAQGLALHGLIQRTVPFSRVLRQASGFDRGPILTRILT